MIRLIPFLLFVGAISLAGLSCAAECNKPETLDDAVRQVFGAGRNADSLTSADLRNVTRSGFQRLFLAAPPANLTDIGGREATLANIHNEAAAGLTIAFRANASSQPESLVGLRTNAQGQADIFRAYISDSDFDSSTSLRLNFTQNPNSETARRSRSEVRRINRNMALAVSLSASDVDRNGNLIKVLDQIQDFRVLDFSAGRRYPEESPLAGIGWPWFGVRPVFGSCPSDWRPAFAYDRDLYPFTNRCIALRFGNIHYFDESRSDNPVGTVLMVHGNPVWSFVYRDIAKLLLARNYRVVAMDFYGFGLSAKPSLSQYSYRPHEQSGILEDFVEALDLNNLTLMAQDWGGPTSLGMAGHQPGRIKNLLLMNTWVYNQDVESAWVRLNRENTEQLISTAQIPRGVGTNIASLFGPPNSAAHQAVRNAYWGPFINLTTGQPISTTVAAPTNIFAQNIMLDRDFLEESDRNLQTRLSGKPVYFLWQAPTPAGQQDPVGPLSMERFQFLWQPGAQIGMFRSRQREHFIQEVEQQQIVDAVELLNRQPNTKTVAPPRRLRLTSAVSYGPGPASPQSAQSGFACGSSGPAKLTVFALPGIELEQSLSATSSERMFVVPEVPLGPSAVRLTDAAGSRYVGNLQINASAPVVGTKLVEQVIRPIALITQGSRTQELIQCQMERCSAQSVALTGTAPTFLTLFGSGWRKAATVQVRIGSQLILPSYAGAGSGPGADQVNFAIPNSVASGEYDLVLIADGVAANAGRISITNGPGAITPPTTGPVITDPVAHAQNSLLANPPKDHPHRPSDPPRPSGNDFVQGYPGDDIDFTAFYGISVITGENGGFDVFNAANPADEMPGKGIVTNVYSGVHPRNIDKSGDRYILGDSRTPYFLGRAGNDDNDFMRIFNLQLNGSEIVLHGSPNDYQMVELTQPEAGTAILYRSAQGLDLVGFLVGRSVTDRTAPIYKYVTAADRPSREVRFSGLAQFGGQGDETIMSVETDSGGNFYVVGLSSSDLTKVYGNVQGQGKLFAAKFSAGGQLQWVRRWGSRSGRADLVLDTSTDGDALYAVGRYVSEIPFGLKDAFLVKIDLQTGNLVKEEIFGGVHVQFAGTVALDNQQALYSAGIGLVDQALGTGEETVQDPYIEKRNTRDLSLVKRVSFGAGTNKEPWGGLAFVPKPNAAPGQGTIYLSGWTLGRFSPDSREVGNGDAWLAAFDQDLNLLWVEQFGSPQRDWAWDLATDASGNVYVVGHTLGAMEGSGPYRGAGDGFIAKFDPTKPLGQRLVWTKQLGTAESDEVRSIKIWGDAIYISGHTRGRMGASANAGQSDIWWAKLDLNGNIIETRQIGTEGDERAFLSVTDRQLILGGFTGGSLTGLWQGGFDGFLMALPRP
jgi:pimeloyl-ACP methyl ester carboxylesterase